MPGADRPSPADAAEFAALQPRDAALREAVREAGALALRHFRNAPRHWTKHDSSPVTEADIAVNELLHARLAQFADDGWLSEESDDHAARLSAHYTWVVDPIDGTRAFMAGEEGWTVSVALVRAGRPVLAALFAPATAEFFHAAAGHGATRNDARLILSDERGRGDMMIAGPRMLVQSIASRVAGAEIAPRIRSLALRFARVADGSLHAAFSSGNSHDWDLAAADLLVHEAGGSLSRLDGELVQYNGPSAAHGILMASRRDLHETMLDHMRESLRT